MKFTNTKKIASSALAILLCASMILSFSLSVYAVDESTGLILAGENFDLASAMCYVMNTSAYDYEAATDPIGDTTNIVMVSVFLSVEAGDTYEDSSFQYNFEGDPIMESAVANVSCSGPAYCASGYHELWASDGLIYSRNTYTND